MVLKEGELYYAFHPAVNNELVRQLQEGIDMVKGDGSYLELLENYR